ncbi:MAG: single-stranded-DNA-specific exonuclease RecJ [Anaerolineae bacterium]
MTPTWKRWDIAPPMPRRQRERLGHIHPVVAQVLFNRGIADPAEAEAFLEGQGLFHDPFRMLGMPAAVERIRQAIGRGERIVVYGDFDADGVTATVLLVQGLTAFGADVRPYIPHRVDEGYGLNCDALRKIAEWGASLVITVDCGIRSPHEVACGNALGLDMIITDHHSIFQGADGVDQLPPALAVINPKRQGDPYPFKDLAGVGIAFKLVQALLMAERRQPIAAAPPALEERDLLDLVALGTVADLAPLLGENRLLVQRGLAGLRKPQRPGVQAMLEEARLRPARVDATAIGFVLGPRLNAAGRLDTAEKSYRLLAAADALSARPLADELGRLNVERQQRTAEQVLLAKAQLEAAAADRLLLLAAHGDFHPGIVGLIAGRLTEEYYRPTLVAQIGPEETHGSGRSIPEFNITAALDECKVLLICFGGHAAAAGFTVANENLPALQARLEEIARRDLEGRDLIPSLAVDAVVPLSDVDFALRDWLAKLEPCGYGNPQPVLASLGLEILEARPVGQDAQHLKLKVRDPAASGPAARLVVDAIAFRQAMWHGQLPRRVDLAYTVELNEYNGEQRLQLNVKDLRPTEKQR